MTLKWYDEFINVFGEITVLQIAELVIGAVAIYSLYKKCRTAIISTHEESQKRERQFEEILEEVKKGSEHRQKSDEIHELLGREIQGLRAMQENSTARLDSMEDWMKSKDKNMLRDILIKHYRYFTNTSRNPNQSWTEMESEAFWALFRDYEEAGGNGYMHTVVRPAMEKLTIVSDSNDT